jgi:hypothetical protein
MLLPPGHKNELSLRINKAPDQPGAGNAIEVHKIPGNPQHDIGPD